MNTLKLTDAQLELVQREMMGAAVKDLKHAGELLEDLMIHSPWPAGPRSGDAQGAIGLLRESLDILDAIGWPADEQFKSLEVVS